MKKEEFNLSGKTLGNEYHYLRFEDVKEFIKLLKKRLNADDGPFINDIIDKLAGEKLK